MFSIPKTIYPVYSVPSSDPVNVILNVGTAVKDQPSGSETMMKKANDLAVAKTKEKFEADTKIAKEKFKADMIQFDKDFKIATENAGKAEKTIGNARNKKAASITSVALCVIATVGLVIGAVASQIWPILFVAAPFAIGIAPSSYFTHTFRKMVSGMRQIIAKPQSIPRPVLHLPIYNPPVYHPQSDLDLLQTRINAQNILASMPKLSQLTNSGYSNDQIISYALLDGFVVIPQEKRPHFYAKCIQLINAQRQINAEYSDYERQARREYENLTRELGYWRSQQEERIRQQERHVRHEEIRIRRHERRKQHDDTNFLSIAGSFLSTWELNTMENDLRKLRSEVASDLVRRETQNHGWLQSNLSGIKIAYHAANAQLELQFNLAKAAAK